MIRVIIDGLILVGFGFAGVVLAACLLYACAEPIRPTAVILRNDPGGFSPPTPAREIAPRQADPSH